MESPNNSSDDSGDGEEKTLALDRLSSLPNPLILHILSFLPTKLAARTSILSKKWQFLWTSVPILDFDAHRDINYYKVCNENLKSFISFIYRSLLLNQSPEIEKFRVRLPYMKAFASGSSVWLRFLSRKNVKLFDLDFSYEDAHPLPIIPEDEDDDDDASDDSDHASGSTSFDDSDHYSSSISSERSKSSGGNEKALDLELDFDRISNLPNPLILRILSFLPTKYAARTSVLSKTWQYLWTSIPIFDFDDCRDIRNSEASNMKNLNRLVSCINRSLLLNQSPGIEKFRLNMYYNEAFAFASDVDVWLRFLTRRNVKELDLNFSSEVLSSNYSSTDDGDDDADADDTRCFKLPMNMFSNNSSLTTLKLGNCDINHARRINWKSLIALSLSRMNLNDGIIAEMLSGCPALELFELLGCCNYEFLDIKSKRLRKLVISECEIPPDNNALPTKISAPYLQSLDISGFLYEYSVINSASLVVVKLNFYRSDSSDHKGDDDKYKKSLVELLENLRHVKDLSVGSLCLQVLSMLEEKAMPCPLSSVACLRVNTSLYKRELPGIIRLLRHTPLLETLIINTSCVSLHLTNLQKEFLKSCDLCGDNYWSSQKITFASALLNLKTVSIIGFGATKSEVELLFFLLKNASTLEKMIIHARNTTNVSLKKSLEVAQRLLSFPRCSQDAVVVFA